MRIIDINTANATSIAEELRLGKTIVYPTETCYGLGCDATSPGAVEKIFQVKKRQKEKSMLLLMADVSMAKKYVIWSEILERIADLYWPGPLTVVAPLMPTVDLPAGVVGPDDTLAFRITSHPFASAVVRMLGRPVVSTSANLASLESPYDFNDVVRMYDGQQETPDILVDAGNLPHHAPSTILSVAVTPPVVLRQGEIRISKDVLHS